MKDLFIKYQKPLLKLANNRFGRVLLGVNPKEKIVGIADNAFVVRDGNNIKAEFRCYPVFAKRIGTALSQWDIAKEYLTGNANLYKGLDEYRGLLNYCGLTDTREFPTVMLTSDVPVYAGSGNGLVGLVNQATWAGTRGATSGTASVGGTTYYVRAIQYYSHFYINRLFFPFDTSGFGDITVSAAVFSAYCSAYASNPEPVVAVQTSQASTSTLEGDDFNNLTFTAGSNTQTVQSTGWKVFTLTEAARLWVKGDEWTKLGIIDNNHDLLNATPPEEAAPTDNATFRFSGYAGVDYDPKLVTTYIGVLATINYLKQYRRTRFPGLIHGIDS